jgi:aminocarboxymuconate-semialdehyde decarboxylase
MLMTLFACWSVSSVSFLFRAGMCEQSGGRLYGFATLPVRNTEACLREVRRLKSLSHIRGVILGTPGAGSGLDHADFRPVLAEIEREGLMIFMHPHYGVGTEHFADTGHALFLALGFPFETSVSVSRLIVTGVLDELPALKVLVAHAGAALPSLIGRLDSCVEHDALLCRRLQHLPSHYFRKLYFDAISYSDIALNGLIQHLDVGGGAGADRIMFGTDNPFFPPLDVPAAEVSSAQWPSTVAVERNVSALPAAVSKKVMFENAASILNIKV